MKIYIIGHKSPDLDCISSAVEYAEFLKKTKRYDGAEIIPARAGEPNKETMHIFSKFNATMPVFIDSCEIDPEDAFVLVDHNELSQRSQKVVSEQVIEIVDHHKINVDFQAPLRIDVRPLGSTSTLIYELFEMYGLKPSKETLGLIVSSILSDTQGLRSSTTTGMDSDIVHKIARELKLDMEKLVFEIFKAKSDIEGLTPEEIVKKDFKIFDFGGKKVYIGQLETVEPEKLISQKDVLIKTLESVKSKEGAGHGFLFITDILKVNSQVIYTNDEERKLVEKAFITVGRDGVADAGPRTSRKKDIAPAIEAAIKV